MFITRRLILVLIALATLLPLSGCGCRRNCGSSSLAPPPGPCCDGGLPHGSHLRPLAP
jgi:hypothetical protein